MNPQPPLVPGSAQLPAYSVVDAIVQDHNHIRSCYEHYINEPSIAKKIEFCNELIRAVSVHSACEEIVVYPYIEQQ